MSGFAQMRDAVKGMKVLVVEDELSLLESTKGFMGKIFEHVSGAANGLEALEMYRQTQFDLIVSDNNMPQMSGIELFGHVKKEGDPFTVILTGDSDIAKLRFEDADMVIQKPASLDDLKQILERLIEHRARS